MTAVTFKNLRATNALTYRELNVPLDNQGLVLITAKNNDSTGSNGSGKSNIWEMLCHLIYGTTGKGLNKKGIVNQFVGKDMLIELDLEVDGTPYLFREARKHHEYDTGYMILKNGEDITPKRSAGKSEPQQLMQEVIGFSLQEYLGLVYLCQKYNHVLVSGTHSEKQSYLSALFGLDKYEVLHKEAKTRSKKIDGEMAGYQSYERDLERCVEALKDIPSVEDLQTKLSHLYSSLKENKAKRQDLTQEVTQLQAASQQAQRRSDAIEGLKNLSFPLISEEDFQEKRTDVEAHLTKVRQTIKSLELMIEKLRHRDTINDQIPASPSLSKEALLATTTDLRQKIPTQQTLLQQIEQRMQMENKFEALNQQRSQYPPLGEVTAEILVVQEESTTVASTLRDAEFALNYATEAKKSLDAITGSTCPTCHRGLSPDEKDLLISGLQIPEKDSAYKVVKTRNQELVVKLSELQQQKMAVERIFQEEKQLLDYYGTLPLDNLEEVTTELQKNTQDLQTAENRLQIWSTIETLTAQLSNLPEGDIPMNESVLQDFQTQKDSFNGELNTLNQAAVWIRDANLDIDGLYEGSEVLQSKRGELSNLSLHIDDMVEEKTILAAKLRERQELEKTKAVAEENLQEATALRPRQIYLPKLVEAFGPKGLKTIRLDLIMQQLVKVLPHYLGPMFAGSGYDVSVGKKLEFELSMMHAGKRVVLPGKGTSGGERKALDMATLFGLRTLRTSHKSANILIVDEPYGDLDAGKRGVLTDLFQQLRTTEAVSSVFVITHEAEVLQHSFDQVWTVVRENNTSTLQV